MYVLRPLMLFAINLMIVPGIFVCSSFLISMCMFIVSKDFLISSTTVIVHAGGAWNGITNISHSVLTGDVNTHSTLWHQYTDEHRRQLIPDLIRSSDHITLKTNHQPECQTPHYNKHHHQISLRCLTHCTTGHRGQLNTHYLQTTYPSSPLLTYDMTTYYNKTDRLSPTTRKQTGHNSRKT